MSCSDCGQVTPAEQAAAAARAEATRQEQGDIDARRVMCLTCPNRRGAAWAAEGRPMGKCGVNGTPLGLTIAGVRPCPQGRYPDQTGRVRWLGISWLGVPMPLRLVARAMGRSRGGIDRLGALPGCGCIERLKVLTRRLAGKLSRA